MPIAFSQRWSVLLAVPLIAFGASTLDLTPAIADGLQEHASAIVAVAPAKSGLLAQRSRVQRVRFAPGENSTTLRSSVVSGTRDIYLLGAKKGQTMRVRIASVENNAVFDLATPPNSLGQRRLLKQEAVTWSNALPATGDYQIIVGSTRGNATYRLDVTIR